VIHPDTEARHTGTEIGLGVFATALIPKGTIVYVMDRLEIVLPANTPLLTRPPYADVVRRYAYRSPKGRWIISWDHGKYVNHSCGSNTLNTGYGFELAVRDILPGEEVTDDYGMLNLPYEMPCLCGASACRGAVRPDDFHRCHARWEGIVQQALPHVLQVAQPLWALLDRRTQADLKRYCRDGSRYRTVRLEQWTASPTAGREARRLDPVPEAEPEAVPVLGAGG